MTFGLDDEEDKGRIDDFRGPPILSDQPFGNDQEFKLGNSSGEKSHSQGKQNPKKPKLGLKLEDDYDQHDQEEIKEERKVA